MTAQLSEYTHWHNTERISTPLEGLSPAQYRAQALEVQTYLVSPTIGDQFTSEKPLGSSNAFPKTPT
ncbi:IS3 family transposase [Arthrobacter gengyunqii]|uniref:Integrase core domain-containing protein n=1 Tax=Arthrobacter gengyunqii TaxID=2886940 RepID=A0ABS8GGX1_9MICC|nr:IS3 family transposase [Arthrobacter gengyunqii]MCC3265889.1 integrase core domain-containing protein [Arthrobacter gengyunqii]